MAKWVRYNKVLVFLAALAPLAHLLRRAYGSYAGLEPDLGANPLEAITHSTGWWTLALLMITLSISPLRRVLRRPQLIKFRRMLGLFAFFYGSLHLITYLWFDKFFDLAEIADDVAKRKFITAGFSAWLLLLPLALTSTAWAIRRLGGRRWQRLHYLVYACATLGVVHFWWLVKADISEPAMFAAVLAVLLGVRVVFWWKKRAPARASQVASPAQS